MARAEDNTEILAGCQSCEQQETQVTLSSTDQTVTLTSEQGTPVVTLSVPAFLAQEGEGSLQVQFAREREPTTQSADIPVQSAVVDIQLWVDGQVVTDLHEPLEICLTPTSPSSSLPDSELCLAYFDTREQRWICEDADVERNAVGQLCGTTPHLTSFALLLGGGVGSSDDIFPQGTVAWLSLGFMAAALLAIAFSLVAVEVRFRYRKQKQHQRFERLDSQLNRLSRS